MRFLFSISFIVLSVIVYFIFSKPLYNEVSTLKSDISVYKEALDNSRNLQEIRDNLLLSYRSINTEDLNKISHLLPDTVSSIELVLEIEKIASANGIFIKDVKFNEGEKEVSNNNDNVVNETVFNSLPYGEFDIDFTAEGDYFSFTNFLEGIEKNLRIVDVYAISFDSKVDPKENNNILSYKVKVKTYWLK